MVSMNKPITASMTPPSKEPAIKGPDGVWQQIRREAQSAATDEPALANFFNATVISHSSLGNALSYYLASKLASDEVPEPMLRTLMDSAFSTTDIIDAVAADIAATVDRDSACTLYLTPFLYFKGFLALQAWLTNSGIKSVNL